MKSLLLCCEVLGAVATIWLSGAPASDDQPASTTNVRDTSTVSGTYGRYPQTPWFNNSTARQHLRLDDAQYNELNRSYRQAWHRYNDGLSRLEDLSQNRLTPEQRQRREGDLRSEFQKDFSANLQSIVTDGVTRQRYDQLDRQYRGYDAFNDPNVRSKLNLTPEQRQAFADYDREWNRQIGSWRNEYSKNRELIAKRFGESQTQARERIKATLTPEQQAQWNVLIGNPFEFHPDSYFQLPTTTEPVTGVER